MEKEVPGMFYDVFDHVSRIYVITKFWMIN